ncbi:MAG: AI-2E family transporter, partial [Thermoleophilaceae bacterium]|nr:AI-2E family transporter [Thermoleophilaceae bacterium]
MSAPDPQSPIDVSGLSNVFSPPRWLREAGFSSWLMVGLLLLVVGMIYLLSMMQTIVMPVITAGIIAAVAGPVVGWLNRRHVPRGIGALLLMLLIVAFGVLTFLLIFGGITSQASSFAKYFDTAKDSMQSWLNSLGIDPNQSANATSAASSGSTSAIKALANGITKSISTLTSLVFFVTLTALSMFFLLKDGPQIRGWVERQMSLPTGVARVITGRGIQSLRGYFAGVTAIAIFNATLVGLGAWVLNVPEVGTIVLVTFFGAYIPYLGAWAAGAFAVLVALGSVGTEAAIAMLVITLLA